MFLKAGKGRFLEDLKDKPVDEVLPILKAKMAEWERKRRAEPMVAKWLHMQVKRTAYRTLRRHAVATQRRRRRLLGRRRVVAAIEAKKAAATAAAAAAGGYEDIWAKRKDAVAAEAEAEAEEEAERAVVEAEVRRELGLEPAGGGGGRGGGLDLMSVDEVIEDVALPELLDPSQLQQMLQGQDFHMMETEIEALLLKAKTEARLRERKRIKEITEQACPAISRSISPISRVRSPSRRAPRSPARSTRSPA